MPRRAISRAMTALFWLLVFVVLLALFGWAIAGFVWAVLWYVLVGVVIGVSHACSCAAPGATAWA